MYLSVPWPPNRHLTSPWSLQVSNYIENNLRVGLQCFYRVGFEGVTETWNVVQHEVNRYTCKEDNKKNCQKFQFSCCGVTMYRDWESVIPETPGNTTWSSSPMISSWSVPDSCCRSDVVGCGQNVFQMTTEEVVFENKSLILKPNYVEGFQNNPH